MSDARLSALDASFLEVESPRAHMHVGWAAELDRRPGCGYAELREHIASRLDRAPRYRQRLLDVPLDLHDPVWVDDSDFEPARHIRHATDGDLGRVVEHAMSSPLDRERPLWEMSIADRLDDGTIGLVGKAHHCMVDGLAAVELVTLLLDPSPDVAPAPNDAWLPARQPTAPALLGAGLVDRARQALTLASWPLRTAASPRRALGAPVEALRTTVTLAGTLLPPAPRSPLNVPGSPRRHLGTLRRPLEDLRRVRHAFGTTVNDVLLAASAGALRRFVRHRGETPARLKTMVPVNVRAEGEALGNRIAFMFVELPCDEPDPVARLRSISADTGRRKRGGEPRRSDALLRAASYLPRTAQRLVAHVAASPRVSNLVVSNIPGPRVPLYMNGCRLRAAYPIVPLADDHALSIGMTTVCDDACFGLYADRRSLPEVGAVAAALDESFDELLEAAR